MPATQALLTAGNRTSVFPSPTVQHSKEVKHPKNYQSQSLPSTIGAMLARPKSGCGENCRCSEIESALDPNVKSLFS